MVKITHIYHSGFVIELDRTVLIFDWYDGRLPDFDPLKTVVVFVTHGCPDHYSPRIWELNETHRRILYVLDCCTAPERKGDNILHVQPGRHYEFGRLLIYTICTNENGVAYVVSADGQNFFHAGDLNVLRGTGATDDENAYSERIYRRQLEKISSWDIDAAMLPLDPGLGEDAPRAIDDYMRIVGCRHLFPMHYWNKTAEAAEYLDDERLLPYRDKICFIKEAAW